jgi:hypothetical protein
MKLEDDDILDKKPLTNKFAKGKTAKAEAPKNLMQLGFKGRN